MLRVPIELVSRPYAPRHGRDGAIEYLVLGSLRVWTTRAEEAEGIMRNSSARACLTVAALILAAIPNVARASWYVTAVGGQMMYADSLRNSEDTRLPLDDAPYWGGRLGWQFNPRWAVQAAAGYSPTNIDTPGGNGETVKVKHIAGDLLFMPLTWKMADVFVMAGGGGIEHKPDITH